MKIKGGNMRLTATLAAVAMSLGFAGTAAAEYPDRPINFIIAAGAGGTSDIRVRSYLPFLEKCLGQPIVPINRTPQNVGWTDAANAAPDGYTLTALSHPNFALSVLNSNDIRFNIDSFDWLANMFENYTTLIVRNDSPFKDISEVVEKVKTDNTLNFGITRLTSDDVLLLLNLRRILGVDITPIPLGDSSQTMAALLGGHVDAIVASADATIRNKEQVRALGIAKRERLEALPDVPTFTEKDIPILGYLMSPVAAPAGLPPEVHAKLTGCFAQMVQDPDFLAQAAERGATVRHLESGPLTELVKQDFELIKGLLDANKELLAPKP